MEIENWIERLSGISNKSVVHFRGYFQHWQYIDCIRESFIEKLDFSAQEHLLEKYSVQDKVFVHIRGGDFLENRHRHHNVNLINYYRTCESLHSNDEFVIFTNDEGYARKLMDENKLFRASSFILEDELSSLYLMSKCKACICANSTFSWWGAYLNINRKIYIPSRYFIPGTKTKQNYDFPNAIKIDV